ncbi:WD40-repeat-containing domain protein [Kickxella alabastrina]|uniref:WD40-repeat-containing domain protein n=1 Tax=Kickxella alabastrina TaxID=61397 RepID=UPI0022201896|nr:WD40-repeat-containing domain protein [Kickxella alabastrina]KAI7823943.1 WD40-repeat-containing domain protein [Kickxella alabastrina]KAJ1939355.1 hypothetical protein GGF37_004432 [Kickxella alabastrina]
MSIYEYALDSPSGVSPMSCIAETKSSDILPHTCFRSAQWSPDGTSIATSSDDNTLRIYSLSETDLSLQTQIPHGETLTAHAWYPYMSQSDPATCCIATATRDQPIHLRDTNTGRVRASYTAYDPHEKLMTAGAMQFGADGRGIFGGYRGYVAKFDLQRSGLPVDQAAMTPSRRSKDGVKGIVSCLDAAGPSGLLACGTFSGYLGLRSQCNLADSQWAWVFPTEYGGRAGVGHMRWSPNGRVLWAESRGAARHIVAWDIRDMRGPLAVIPKPAGPAMRGVAAQQRMQFDFDMGGRFLVTGECNGQVTFHDTWNLDAAPVVRVVAHDDLVSGVSSHPYYPMLATASGQRHFDNDSESSPLPLLSIDNSLKVWSVAASYCPYEEDNDNGGDAAVEK